MDTEKMLELKEGVFALIGNEDYKPMKLDRISILLGVSEYEKDLFSAVMNDMVKKREVIKTKKEKIILSEKVNLFAGTFVSNPKGFGFVMLDAADKNDIFIPAPYVRGARHTDRVICKIKNHEVGTKRAEGEIVEILERGIATTVGTFTKDKSFGFVVPDDKKIVFDIFIPKDKMKGAKTGQKVVVKITKEPAERRSPEGEVLEILGYFNEPGVDVLSIVRQYEIPIEYPNEVIAEADRLPYEILDRELVGRTDLRDWEMVTIDGEDTKDIDDAVSLSVLENGNYKLGVHIADVTHYVKANSHLDAEAFKRGTSVYLADRVIPMLPQKLSNGICSLNANVDRLALSCIMEIDKRGMVISHEICETVIYVKNRMTYTIVDSLLVEDESEYKNEYAGLIPMFKNMETLCKVLREKRIKRGAIEFGFPEAKIIVDEDGKPIDIVQSTRNLATSIIEEFMLVSNETIAERFFWLDIPFVFRTHEEPDSEKIRVLSAFINNFGYFFKGSASHPKSIQKLLSSIESTKEELVISRVVLRSFKQARYTSENLGHYGLAAKYYTHFTSPIRRYPDLQIHRIIKEQLHGNLKGELLSYLTKNISDICKKCSINERRAEEVEREVINLKKVQFMADKVGETFDGIISGTTSWGIYVELTNTVEGMIAVSNLDDDYYIYDEKHMMYVGRHTKKVYRLGDKVKIEIIKANVMERKLDFILVDES